MVSDSPPVPRDQPLDRLLHVLDVVAHAERPITMTDVAAACGLPVPTVHRLVAQLEERQLLKRVLGTKKLMVGAALVNLGMAAVSAAMRADQSHQILVALSNRIGEHCQIGQRVDDDVVYVDAAYATRSQGLHFEHGRRSPLYCTSIGKLFLSEMPADRFEWWLAHAVLEPRAPNTIVSADVLRKVIHKVRKEQWAASNEEVMAGVVGCAVPVHDAQGKLIAGLGISVPSARVAYDALAGFRLPMEAAAAEIAAAIAAAQ